MKQIDEEKKSKVLQNQQKPSDAGSYGENIQVIATEIGSTCWFFIFSVRVDDDQADHKRDSLAKLPRAEHFTVFSVELFKSSEQTN